MTTVPPRDVPNRDDFYMGLVYWIASKSKDPNTQVGALIISDKNQPLGWGYNGPPPAINDKEINWARPEKYDWIEHAEENAIDFSDKRHLENATLYVNAKPCKKCMLKIVKSGIKKVIYCNFKSDKDSSLQQNSSDKTDEIARKGGIFLQEFRGNLNWMRDRIETMSNFGIF